MGKLIRASFKDIYPGEELFTTRILAEVIERARREPLFVIPVRIWRDKFVNLDGRHRLIRHKLTGETEIELFLSENPDDVITEDVYRHKNLVQYIENNRNIKKRWSWVERDDSNRHWIKSANYNNYEEYFARLQEHFPYLADFDTCVKHLIKEGYITKGKQKLARAR